MIPAIVLAGGKSSRMGRPKGLIPFGGVPMLERVTERLSPVFDPIVVVGGEHRPPDTWLVPDPEPGAGPLAAILTGLREALPEGRGLAVAVACDMPFVDPDVLRALVRYYGGYDAVVPRWADGHLEPLHAVYRESCMASARAALDRGERRADALLADVRVRYLDERDWQPGWARSWRNVNTPEDLAQAESEPD
jgi:molybdopterin-guanine dinucleotide biosynthesis protein A